MTRQLGPLLVILQFAGIGLCCYAAAKSLPPAQPVFMLIAAAGILLGLYTLAFNKLGNFNIAPNLKTNAQLITTGPYQLIRHPMYLSVILFLLGVSLLAGQLLAWAGFIISTGAMIQKSLIEEKLLLERFPEYGQYRTKTKRILPFIF
ncbi:MAG: isoprenylcysteine carboxylmethyltransferase family protein [Rhodothermales bacterium]